MLCFIININSSGKATVHDFWTELYLCFTWLEEGTDLFGSFLDAAEVSTTSKQAFNRLEKSKMALSIHLQVATDSAKINRPRYNIRHIFTLLLAHFESKLVNYSWHSESLKIFGRIPKSTTFSFDENNLSIFKQTSKTHCTSNNWPISQFPPGNSHAQER